MLVKNTLVDHNMFFVENSLLVDCNIVLHPCIWMKYISLPYSQALLYYLF